MKRNSAFLLFLLLYTMMSVAQNTKYVNLFIGTSGDNGQVAPGATVPFGMTSVCPDNAPRSHAGYYIAAFSNGVKIELTVVRVTSAARPANPDKVR